MSDETLASIDRSLKRLVEIAEKKAAARVGDVAGPAVADDRDLDGKYGNEMVSFSPRDWTGDSCKGRRMSECPPDFLDVLALAFDHFAKKNDAQGLLGSDQKTPKSTYDRRSAARARGWAKRLRDGWKPAQPALDDDFGRDGF